ncbi:hypothetical protein [Rhizorhapis sp. SPR117]
MFRPPVALRGYFRPTSMGGIAHSAELERDSPLASTPRLGFRAR